MGMMWLDEGGRQRDMHLIAPPPSFRSVVGHLWVRGALPRNPWRPTVQWLALSLLIVPLAAGAQTTEVLHGTEPLTWEGDLSARMVAGIDEFLMRELDRSVVERQRFWKPDFSSRAAYEKSVQQNRQRFQKYIGTVDPRLPVKALEYHSTAALPLVAETDQFRVYAVRWPVFHDVHGEGFCSSPKAKCGRAWWLCPTPIKLRRCWSAWRQAWRRSRNSQDGWPKTAVK